MAQVKVQTPELAVAAGVIGAVAGTCRGARGRLSSAAGETGSFGGEPVGDAFSSMCQQAEEGVRSLAAVLDELSRNVAMAAVGYVRTDEGVIPIQSLQRGGATFRP